MKVNELKDFFKKSSQEKNKIRNISNNLRDSFSKAFNEAEKSINNELRKLSIETDEAQRRLDLFNELRENDLLVCDSNGNINYDEIVDIYGEFANNDLMQEIYFDALLSMSEMKIVFLYKTVETALNSMFSIAIKNIDKKSLYKFDTIVFCAKNINIDLKSIEGYREFDALRIVNNNIKHSSEIDNKILSIDFWKNETGFTYEKLEEFYDTIEGKVIKFISLLGEEIINSIYIFDNEKLKEMACDLKDKLSEGEIEILIKYLNESK